MKESDNTHKAMTEVRKAIDELRRNSITDAWLWSNRSRPLFRLPRKSAWQKFKDFVGLALVLLSTLSLQAGDIITATVIVTTPANLTNHASLTLSSDTRIWTNSVTTPSTQIRSSTTAASAANNLLQHFRAYPFSGVQTSATNNGIVLTGADGASLSLVQTNSWATIAYRTNTVGTAWVVRAPRSAQQTAERAPSDDRVIDGINNAPTNIVSASAASMVNFVAKPAHSALTADSAVTNFVANFTGDAYRTITAAADVNLIQSTNRAAVRSIVLFIDANGADRDLTMNADWKQLGSIHTVVTNGTIGILSLTTKGTAETDVYAAYSVAQ